MAINVGFLLKDVGLLLKDVGQRNEFWEKIFKDYR